MTNPHPRKIKMGEASAARQDKKMAEPERRCGISPEAAENCRPSSAQRSTDTADAERRHELLVVKCLMCGRAKATDYRNADVH
jgi:hypothetical protein